MLPAHLVTNEVKNIAGTEVQYNRIRNSEREVVYEYESVSPSLPDRITVTHEEVGQGTKKRRRSRVRVDFTTAGEVDTATPAPCVANLSLDIPIGNITELDIAKQCLARLLSFCASTGADTTVKYDCTGTGAAALVSGSL